MSIVENIKSLCGKDGISIPKLEKDLGFSKGSVYNWDKNSPSVDKLQKVANYFSVSVDSLLANKNQTPTIKIDLSSQPHELQIEIAKILIAEPTIEKILEKLNQLPEEKREVILRLIETM